MKSVLIIGCGDIGKRVARLCQQKGAVVSGLARSEQSAKDLQSLNITPISGDLSQSESLQGLFNESTYSIDGADVYYFAPPPSKGATDPYIFNFLSAISGDHQPTKIILISTTAVYGDCQGKWITEEQPVNPQTDRGLRRLDAENSLRSWSEKTGVPIVILRVGGIYGAGRLPIERLEKGLPILKESESPFTNRIHQDDLAQICVAAGEYGSLHERKDEPNVDIYNVSDGQPSTMSFYFKAVAKANGISQPPEISRAKAESVMSAGMLSYLKESRRLENKSMLQGLQITLRYKNLEEGLKSE